MGLGFSHRLGFAAAVVLAACRPSSPSVDETVASVTPEDRAVQERRYEELTARLAPEGAAALAALATAPDPAHGAVFYQGRVPADGSTAYLRLVQLGSGGGTLRLVIRYQGGNWFEAGQGAVMVDGQTVGTFIPQKIRAERTGEGVVQLFDTDANTLLPALTALLEASSAEILLRGPRGQTVVSLDGSQLDEMRQVFAAYLHLQGSP